MSRREADSSRIRRQDVNTLVMNVSDAAFLFAFGLYVLISLVETTTFETILGFPTPQFVDVAQAVVLVLLLFKFLSQSISVPSLIAVVSIAIIGFISWRQAQEAWLFWISLFVACSQDIKIKRVSTVLFVVTAGAVLVTVLCALAGLIDNLVSTRAGTVRYALGFKHPNFLGIHLLLLCVTFSFRRNEKSRIPDIIMIGLMLLVNTAISDSRTSTLLLLLLALMICFYRFIKRDRTRRILSWLLFAIVIGLVLMSYWLMIAYDPGNSIYAVINSALSDRVRLANSYFEMKRLTLFGGTYDAYAPIYWSDGNAESFVVDNAYCHLLLRFGIVPTAIFLVGLFGLLFKSVRRGTNDGIFLGLALMCVCGLTETFGIRIDYNFFLLEIGDCLLFPRGSHFSGLIEIPVVRRIGQKSLRLPSKDVSSNSTVAD